VFSQSHPLNIRDGAKICTQWVKPVNGQFQMSYSQQHECTSDVFF